MIDFTKETGVQECGSVVAVEGGRVVIQSGSDQIISKKAVSCLLEPAVGDVALFMTAPSGQSYVLAILERNDGENNSITLSGDTDIIVKDGSLALCSQEKVTLGPSAEVSINSASFCLSTLDGKILADRMSFLGSLYSGHVDVIKLSAKYFDSVLERLSQKMKSYYRKVEDEEVLKAGRIDYKAEKTLVTHAENTIITSKENVKIDGDLLHLG